jgi:hypothetical protein
MHEYHPVHGARGKGAQVSAMPRPSAAGHAWRCALLLTLLLAPLAAAAGQRATLVVEGTVVDSSTGAPLGGVALEQIGTAVRAMTQTDGAGRFRIGSLRAGGYRLVVRPIGDGAPRAERLELARDTTLALGRSRLAREIASGLVHESVTGIQGVIGTAAGLEPPRTRAGAGGRRARHVHLDDRGIWSQR